MRRFYHAVDFTEFLGNILINSVALPPAILAHLGEDNTVVQHWRKFHLCPSNVRHTSRKCWSNTVYAHNIASRGVCSQWLARTNTAAVY